MDSAPSRDVSCPSLLQKPPVSRLRNSIWRENHYSLTLEKGACRCRWQHVLSLAANF